ncbi:MAG: rhodanese-like domain-containing protein [Desulfuromonadales bacterium]|nr:rhodanese-like domain-containing protein [Desulfuromonadales bacterium]
MFAFRRSLVAALLLSLVAAPVAAQVRNISPGEAKALLQDNPGVFLLDVRTLGEYQQSRLAGARLIPIDQVTGRLGEIPLDRPVLIYCAVGSRSGQVAEFLSRQGGAEIYNLFGGIWGWRLRGLPVLTGGP